MTITALYRGAFIAALVTIYLLAMLPGDSLPEVQLWDKLQHACAFFMLALLLGLAWPSTSLLRLQLPSLFAYGVLIELSQSLVPYREASTLDLVANASGLVLYVGAVILGQALTGRSGAKRA
jgi:VanZ family protein